MKLIFRMNSIKSNRFPRMEGKVYQTYNVIRIIQYHRPSSSEGWEGYEEHDVLPEEWRFLFKRLYMYVVLP